MNSIKFSLLLYITLFHLLSPVVCFSRNQPSDTLRGLLVEGKKKLGSTPPGCRKKCNGCHPCMAVQIPTLPSPNRLLPGPNRVTHNHENFDPSTPISTANYKYSNYKPLGWKCSCGDHFFNP